MTFREALQRAVQFSTMTNRRYMVYLWPGSPRKYGIQTYSSYLNHPHGKGIALI